MDAWRMGIWEGGVARKNTGGEVADRAEWPEGGRGKEQVSCHLSCNFLSPERLEGRRVRSTFLNATHAFLIEKITLPEILRDAIYRHRKKIRVWGAGELQMDTRKPGEGMTDMFMNLTVAMASVIPPYVKSHQMCKLYAQFVCQSYFDKVINKQTRNSFEKRGSQRPV